MDCHLVNRRVVLSMAAAMGLRAQTSGDEHQIMHQFYRWWLSDYMPEDASRRYRAKLASEGLPADEVERQMRIIDDQSPAGRSWRIDSFWGAAAEFPANAHFRITPSPWLVASVQAVKPGRALDLGMGQGRNCLFLAKAGWEVTGIEQSAVAVKQSQAEAEKARVRYTTVLASIDEWDMGHSRWDLVVSTFEPDVPWANRICDSLTTDGLFVREQYGSFQRNENAVLQLFGRLRILRYEDKVDFDNYDPVGPAKSKQPERIIRLLAQKTRA